MQSKTKLKKIFTKLTGNPLSIAMLMTIFEGEVTYQEIEDWCQITRPTARRETKKLMELGIIEKVTDARFRFTDLGKVGFTLSPCEKFFHQEEEFINLIIDRLNIYYSSSSCKIFTASPDVFDYLASKGVYKNLIDELAYLTNNDLELLRKYFDVLPVGMAIWRIKRGEKPEQEPEEKYISGKYADFIER